MKAISQCITGKSLTAGKFQWKYYTNNTHDITPCRDKSTNAKKVAQLDSKGNIIRIFNSIKEAKKELGFNHIANVCNGTRNHTGGYKFKHV